LFVGGSLLLVLAILLPWDSQWVILILFATQLVVGFLRPARTAHAGASRPTAPWYYFGILGALAIPCAIAFGLDRAGKPLYCFRVTFFGFSSVCFAVMVWKFVRVRQQFTLRTLMLAVFVEAILCSVSRYVGRYASIPFLLLFLLIPALALATHGPPTLRLGAAKRARSRSTSPPDGASGGDVEDGPVRIRPSDADCQCVADMLEQATPCPPSPSRGNDGPNDLKSEI
jgi:hypothetical protein